jgi:hypothetical protein
MQEPEGIPHAALVRTLMFAAQLALLDVVLLLAVLPIFTGTNDASAVLQ